MEFGIDINIDCFIFHSSPYAFLLVDHIVELLSGCD